MEPQGPQHLPKFDLPHVAQFPHLIWQLCGLLNDEKNSHNHAYMNPLLIQGLGSPSICRSQRFFHLPCVILTMQVDIREYFKIAFVSCFVSLDWVALCKNSSLLLGP